jgi:hypothetical protein
MEVTPYSALGAAGYTPAGISIYCIFLALK